METVLEKYSSSQAKQDGAMIVDSVGDEPQSHQPESLVLVPTEDGRDKFAQALKQDLDSLL